jgi:hypothetical protein
MQHMRFKAEQTAAHYVANGLDEKAQEAFELHMMGCAECVSDVEVWRAIKHHLPGAANEQAGDAAKPPSAAEVSIIGGMSGQAKLRSAHSVWRAAAALGGVAVVAGAAGWYGHALRGPGAAIATGQALFYTLAPLTRSVECAPFQIGQRASVVLLRIPGAVPDAKLVARYIPGGTPAAPLQYHVREQGDGSWILQLSADALRGRSIGLAVQQANEAPLSLGCIAGKP